MGKAGCKRPMINRLNQYFIEQMREKSYAMMPAAVSSVPNYPACVVYLTPSAKKRHEQLIQCLRRIWRGGVNDLCCYETAIENGGCRISRADGGSMNLLAEIQRMFSTQTKFHSRSGINIYCVLDSADVKDIRSFADCINMACYFKQCTKMKNSSLFLLLLLDESLQNQQYANQIRAWMRGQYQNLLKHLTSVCLISNRCGDGTTLDSYQTTLAAANAILLTDTHNEGIAARMQAFRTARVFTLAHSSLQKPVDEIGWVVLKNTVERLCAVNAPVQTDKGKLSELLHLSPDGCFTTLEPWEKQRFDALPSAQELEFFPRREPYDGVRLADLSYAEFDQLTMGSVESCLRNFGGSSGTEFVSQAAASYQAQLSAELPISVLAGLSESTVHTLFFETHAAAAYQQSPVLTALQWILHKQCSDLVREAFYDAVCGLITQAKQQVSFYKNLQAQLLLDYGFIHFSPNVEQYYGVITQRYLDAAAVGQGQSLKCFQNALLNEKQIEENLKRVLDEIISSNESFYTAFDEEMRMRIGKADYATVAAAVQSKLLGHGSGSNACWNTPYPLSPFYRAILMNLSLDEKGSLLTQQLKSMFGGQSVEYFNTGNSDAVESVTVFLIEPAHLFGTNEEM